ncbi:hypothetical protein I4U23_004454 [Adineta vaga]|nr:hypothetical protein I4U23_004454 [Adineta vaga]
MGANQLVIIFLLGIVLTNASHYRGGSLSWSIHENTTNGSSSTVLVRITQRHSYRKTYSSNTFCNQTTIATGGMIGDGSVTCLGDCSGISSNGSVYTIPTFSTNVPCTDFNDDFDYSSGEGSVDVIVPRDVRFTYAVQSCCWISLLEGSGSWSLALVVDTHTRRNGKLNNSPKTASNPVVQVQLGRTHTIPIPMADTDGDALRCRWGNTTQECGSICVPKGQLQAFPCQLTYEATTLGYEGIALVIEDYDPITNETLSSIPLQFLIRIVDQTQVTVLPDLNYTGSPILQACTVPPVYVGDRHHGACIGVASNTTITERIVVKVPCNESSTTITDILTVSPSGMIKSPITVDLNNNDTYIMFIEWTPLPEQYGIHQLCFTPVDSIGQNGQQVCYTFQVDVGAPQFINGSMTPKGLVLRNQALWSISTDRNIVPPHRQ